MLVLTSLRAASSGVAAQDSSVSFEFGTPTTILSTQDMDRYGVMFPDGTLSFLRQDSKDGEPYLLFAAGGSFGGAGMGAHLLAGTYAFAGTLDSFHPMRRGHAWPTSALTVGRLQPSPEGTDFDRDYAGGGPTYRLAQPSGGAAGDFCSRWPPAGTATTPRSGPLLQIYHGEIHLLPPKAMPGYGGSGMAVSCDGGQTFEKIGQILAPHLSRAEFLEAHVDGGLWIDGAMIEGDANGERGCVTTACPPGERFYYLIFTDHNSVDERYTGLSIARTRAEDLFSAIRQHRAPSFRKYYNPSGLPALQGDHFTEPGLGGRSTPVVLAPGQHMNTPGILYDDYLGRFVLFYQTNQKQVELRTALNVFSWSPAEVAFQLDAASNRRVFYPSVAGREDADPQVPGQTFYLYFLVRERTSRGFVDPQLLREWVSVTRRTH